MKIEKYLKTLKITKKNIISLSILLSILLNIFLVKTYWGHIRPHLSVIKSFVMYPTRTNWWHRKELSSIKNYITSKKFNSERERLDFIRNWVHQNSVHQNGVYKYDKSHVYSRFPPTSLSLLWNFHRTSKSPPYLTCGPRAIAMKAILDMFSIPNKMTHIFTDNYPYVASHTFLDVYNKESKDWEIQDPDYNVHYIDKITKRRLSTIDLIQLNLDSVLPVSTKKQGWLENKVHHLKKDFFEAMMYDHHNYGGKSIMLINLKRFNPHKRFNKNQGENFFEYANKRYLDPFFIKIN